MLALIAAAVLFAFPHAVHALPNNGPVGYWSFSEGPSTAVIDSFGARHAWNAHQWPNAEEGAPCQIAAYRRLDNRLRCSGRANSADDI